MVRNLPPDHAIWRFLRESADLMCWLRLQKRYKEADEERDLIREKLGLEVRMRGRHVTIADRAGPLAWTHDT